METVQNEREIELEFRRKVISQRTTLYLALPKPWAQALKIRKGDYLTISFGRNGNLTVKPEVTEGTG